MQPALRSLTVSETRGQAARRRRAALGVARDRIAQEAGVSVRTVKSYEDDERANMPSGRAIEDALDRLEAARGGPGAPHRRRSDSPRTRYVLENIEGVDGDVVVRTLADGTRAIFVVPEGGRIPTTAEIEQAIRQARGE